MIIVSSITRLRYKKISFKRIKASKEDSFITLMINDISKNDVLKYIFLKNPSPKLVQFMGEDTEFKIILDLEISRIG